MAIAELRTAGNGTLGAAEAESFDAEQSDVFNLVQVSEQIYNQAEAQAEIPIDFAESAQELIDASSEMLEWAPELTPLSTEISSEVAEDFAFLKVLKSSAVLESAAGIDPYNKSRSAEAVEMIDAAMEVYESLESDRPCRNDAEFIEGVEKLTAYSERYVGVSERFSGQEAFELAALTLGDAVSELHRGTQGDAEAFSEGAGILFAASENVYLSSEYYAEGEWNLETASGLLEEPFSFDAADLVPFAELIIAESQSLENSAQGGSAEVGAAEMISGAEFIFSEAIEGGALLDIAFGGETLELGAEQYIAGSLAFEAGGHTNDNAGSYLLAAESIEQFNGGNSSDHESLELSSAELLQASEDYYVAAEALEFISGEYFVIETPEIIESGPEIIEIFDSVPVGADPEVFIVNPENIEIISAESVEFIPSRRPRSMEIGSEVFNFPRPNPEVIAEVTEAIYPYPAALQGIDSLEAASLEMFEGAEYLLEYAAFEHSSAEENAAELSIEGAELVIEGAIEAFETPEFVQDGAATMEIGTLELSEGAIEFLNA